MATDKVETVATSAAVDTAAIIAAAVAAGVAEALKGAMPAQEVKFGKVVSPTPFDPTGKRKRDLKRVTTVNGLELNPRMLSTPEMDLLDQITKGSYIEGKVQVLVDDTDLKDKVHIRYKCGRDQRQDLATATGGTFTGILQRIVNEGKEKQLAMKAARSKEIRDAIEE